MKIISKFKLELPIAWQALVAPGHGILLGLIPLFLVDKVDALIILAVKSS
jgi:hypothetical protein